jgi:hypothetical protein
MDVKVFGDHVYVAEGTGGLSIWRRDGASSLTKIGGYRAGDVTIRQVVIPPPGKYALLHVGSSALHIVDVSNPADVKCVLKDTRTGLLYGDQIADGLLEGRYACVFWHVSGLYWYDLYGGAKPVYTGDNYGYRFDAQNGVALLEHAALVTYQRGYIILQRGETRPPDELPKYGVEGQNLSGKPCVFGNRLYITNRFTGRVSTLDITDVKKPKLLESFDLDGKTGRAVVHKGALIILAGYEGLLVCE